MIIDLSFVEKLVLKKIKQDQKILMIPIDIFVSVLLYSEQIEDYETCAKLMRNIERVPFKTSFMFYDDFIDEQEGKRNRIKLLSNDRKNK